MKKVFFSLLGLCLLIGAWLLLSPDTSIHDDTLIYSKQLYPLAPDSIVAWDTKMTFNPEDSTGELAMQAKYDAMVAVRDYYNNLNEDDPLLRTGNTEWIEIGPSNVGGRTRAILIDKNDPTGETVWAGGVSGGLWKSTDGGNSWVPIDALF